MVQEAKVPGNKSSREWIGKGSVTSVGTIAPRSKLAGSEKVVILSKVCGTTILAHTSVRICIIVIVTQHDNTPSPLIDNIWAVMLATNLRGLSRKQLGRHRPLWLWHVIEAHVVMLFACVGDDAAAKSLDLRAETVTVWPSRITRRPTRPTQSWLCRGLMTVRAGTTKRIQMWIPKFEF